VEGIGFGPGDQADEPWSCFTASTGPDLTPDRGPDLTLDTVTRPQEAVSNQQRWRKAPLHRRKPDSRGGRDLLARCCEVLDGPHDTPVSRRAAPTAVMFA